MSPALTFKLPHGDDITIEPRRLIIAGYTGRDEAAVRRHIDELADQGIAPPPTVPMFYELEPTLLTTEAHLTVTGTNTSGEVEPVYVRASGHWYLGIGSDHTDRLLERDDIQRSKASCVKPIGTTLLPLPDDVLDGGYDASFDKITVASWVDATTYQDGTLATLRPPGDVLTRLFDALGPDDESDIVVYGGTVPLRGGAFVFGTDWRMVLDTGADPSLEHSYTITVSPVST